MGSTPGLHKGDLCSDVLVLYLDCGGDDNDMMI